MIKETFYKLTGGRPMTELEYYFNDKSTNRPVYRYQDKLGRFWMAHTKWDRNRKESVNENN